MKLFKRNLYAFTIAVLIIGIYSNTLKNAFQFDDIIHVLNNEDIKSPSNLTHILKDVSSRPLLFATFAIIHAKRGEMDKAIEGFKKTLELAPNYMKAKKNLEIALKGMTNFEGSTSVDRYR